MLNAIIATIRQMDADAKKVTQEAPLDVWYESELVHPDHRFDGILAPEFASNGLPLF